ncbi:MAG: hypothetical protein HC871_11100 [Rhizobiales bacterium]|nr:hypothetical protein [Hyphomicrobiales bacterium]
MRFTPSQQSSIRLLGLTLLAGAALAFSGGSADAKDKKGGGEPFGVADLFIELNDTDGDLGLQSLIDGDAWTQLDIADSKGKKILQARLSRNLAKQGLNELFFESAEPSFDELSPDEFFKRFPAGTYKVSARKVGGGSLASSTEVTHVLPAPAGNIAVNGQPTPASCDEGEKPVVSSPVQVTWDAVTTSHPEIGAADPNIEVTAYELVAEIDETPFRATGILPSSVTSFLVPDEILSLGDEVKLEVGVNEASGNRTVSETCFTVGNPA